jgi:hypothetical protein
MSSSRGRGSRRSNMSSSSRRRGSNRSSRRGRRRSSSRGWSRGTAAGAGAEGLEQQQGSSRNASSACKSTEGAADEAKKRQKLIVSA